MKVHLKIILLALISFNAAAQGQKWEKFDFTNSLIPFEKIFCIEFDNNGNVFFGTNVTNDLGHIGIFDGRNFSVASQGKWIYDIKCDSKGNIWALNSSSELAKWNGVNWSYISNPDLSWYSNPMHIDENDHIWANPGFESKILEYDGAQWNTYDLSNSKFPDDHISCIITSGTNLFIGTNDSGLAHFDGNNWVTYKASNSLVPDDRIYASCKDQQDTLWFITRGGFIFGIKDNSWVIYQHNNLNEFTSQIDVDSKGNFWVSQTNKIIKYDKKTATFYDYTNSILPRNSINTIAVDACDKVWIGTRNGLFSFRDSIDTVITIIKQPENVNLKLGDTAVLEVKAKGCNMKYQWMKNSDKIFQANISTYRINGATASDAGKYKCRICNEFDTIESKEVEVSFNSGAVISNGNINNKISVYPIIVSDYLFIKNFTETSEYSVSIRSTSGKLIFRKLYSNKPDVVCINLKTLAIQSGYYLVTINSKYFRYTESIIYQ